MKISYYYNSTERNVYAKTEDDRWYVHTRVGYKKKAWASIRKPLPMYALLPRITRLEVIVQGVPPLDPTTVKYYTTF